jgi:ribosome-binding factor A
MGTFDDLRGDWRKTGRGRKWGGERGGGLQPIYGDDASHDRKPDYKTAALCKQVRRAVGLTLAGECGDPVLQELIVEEVLPAPHAGRLMVRVFLRARPDGPRVADVLPRLAAVEGLLRARVGEAIVRKRTPELVFDVIPLGPPGAGRSESEASLA